jgi:hypothetical protein
MPEARCSSTAGGGGASRRTRQKKDAAASSNGEPGAGKTRRGRKSKSVVNAYNMQSMVSKHDDEDDLHDGVSAHAGVVGMHDENLIIHLNIKKDWSASEGTTPTFPNAYNGYADNAFQSVPMDYPEDHFRCRGKIKAAKAPTPTPITLPIPLPVPATTTTPAPIIATLVTTAPAAAPPPGEQPQQTPDLRVVDLLKDFEVKSKNSEWPTTTNISCYWCCHPFANVPFGMPVKYTGSKFHVCGCFCSLECVTAYNFASNESQSEKWERYNLTNLLSRMIGHADRVKPAPSRLTLKMFGGHMDIEEFRRFFATSKILNINFPPMMTLTQQIEELNECDVSSEYKYIPLDIDRINRYKEKMTLKRTKPVTDYKNTLDCMMNLKIQ